MHDEHPLRIPVRFYRTASGREPVRKWLRTLHKENRNVIGRDLMRVQFGWPVGMPLVRSLKNGLWEIRSTLPSRRIARLILSFHENEIVAHHGFIKKTQKTPLEETDVTRQSIREVTS